MNDANTGTERIQFFFFFKPLGFRKCSYWGDVAHQSSVQISLTRCVQLEDFVAYSTHGFGYSNVETKHTNNKALSAFTNCGPNLPPAGTIFSNRLVRENEFGKAQIVPHGEATA